MGLFNKKIVSTQILDNYTETNKSASSSFIRGTVGGMLFGGVGAVAGSLSGKNKNTHYTTFLIKYSDGSQDTQTVKNNSVFYETFMKFLDK